MNSLTEVVDSLATDSIAVAAETVQDNLNVLDLAMKGGWIMIILALLSVIGIYIFFERFSVLRKAGKKNPMPRLMWAEINPLFSFNTFESSTISSAFA